MNIKHLLTSAARTCSKVSTKNRSNRCIFHKVETRLTDSPGELDVPSLVEVLAAVEAAFQQARDVSERSWLMVIAV
jgi:hypothetical protein